MHINNRTVGSMYIYIYIYMKRDRKEKEKNSRERERVLVQYNKIHVLFPYQKRFF